MIKDTFKSIGYIILGIVSLFVVVGMLVWEGLKMFGKLVAWVIDMKIQEKYHADEIKK